MNLYKAINIQFWIIFWFGSFCCFIEGKPCSGGASYKLSFSAEWSNNSRPFGAKFSGLLGTSHNHCYQMWQPGRRASVAVKNVAENGVYQELQNEISKLVLNRTTLMFRYYPDTIDPSGVTSNIVELKVDALHPRVSVITKIFPSPDWFLGVRNVDLCNRTSGKWLRGKKETRLIPYDAGTDSGTQFTSTDEVTKSPKDISRFSNEQFSSTWGVDPIKEGLGFFQFSQTELSSGTGSKTENDETFKCPNLAPQMKWSCLTLLTGMVVFLELVK